MESAFGMRIPDGDPGGQNHVDPRGCGSVTLVKYHLHQDDIYKVPDLQERKHCTTAFGCLETTNKTNFSQYVCYMFKGNVS
jgi:hypothetical protein